MSQVQEIKDTRAKLLQEAKTIVEKAKAEQREITAEESVRSDAIYNEFDGLGAKLNTLEKQSKLEQAEGELRQAYRKTTPNPVADPLQKGNMGEAVRSWFLTGTDRYRASGEALDNAQRCGIDLRSKKCTLRQMLKSNATAGTGLVQWTEFFDSYEIFLKYYGDIVNYVTEVPTETGVAMPIPTFDDTNNRGRWLGEAVTASATDPSTGTNVVLGAWKASSDQIPVSVELMQDSQVALDMVLPMLLGERIGRLLNQAVIAGDGVAKPRGILLDATASGVVAGGTGASPVVSIDNLLNLKYSVDPAYRRAPAAKRGFLMTDTTLAAVRKSKDGNSRYFADPFVSGPGTLDGDQIIVNADLPVSGVNAKLAAYGDFSKYILRRVKEVQFLKLEEIRALDGMVVFLAFARYDGALINTQAVKTLAASAT